MYRAGVRTALCECLYRSQHKSYTAGMWIPSHSTTRTVPASLGCDPRACRGPGNSDPLTRWTCRQDTSNYKTHHYNQRRYYDYFLDCYNTQDDYSLLSSTSVLSAVLPLLHTHTTHYFSLGSTCPFSSLYQSGVNPKDTLKETSGHCSSQTVHKLMAFVTLSNQCRSSQQIDELTPVTHYYLDELTSVTRYYQDELTPGTHYLDNLTPVTHYSVTR